jgi:transposase
MLGIDVSKDTLSCAFYDATQQRFLWEQVVPNSPAGVAQLLDRTPPEVPWVLEPTGRYSLSVAVAAQAAGRQPLMAPPRKAKAYLNSLQSRAKTDRLDGRGLSLFGASRPATHPLPPYPIKAAEVEELDQLLSARRGVVDALMRLRQQRRELPHAAGPLQEAITALEAQREVLDGLIAAAVAAPGAFPAVAALQAVPGIGPITAAAVGSRLRAKQFTHSDQFVAYIGLDVVVRQSGKRAGKRGLSKQGDAELRRLLFMCARSTLTAKKSPFQAQYQRERDKGLAPTAALNAVARKMARMCWSLFQHGTEYDPERVFQQANSRSDEGSSERETGS